MSYRSTKEPRRRTAEEIGRQLQETCDVAIEELIHERRVSLPRLERYALDALQREERFASEHSIARAVLDADIPTREREIDATLLLLQESRHLRRVEFLIANYPTRRFLIEQVLRQGGLYDTEGRWRSL